MGSSRTDRGVVDRGVRRHAFCQFRQPEVEDLQLPVARDLHVGWLEVAVQHAALVGVVERIAHLPGQVEGVGNGERSAAHAFGQRLAVDEFEHERTHVGAVAVAGRRHLQPVDRRDVWMVQGGEHFRLALKPGETVRIRREGDGQDLQGDVTFQP